MNLLSQNAVEGIDLNTHAGAQRCKDIFSVVGNRPAEIAARDLARAYEDLDKARLDVKKCRDKFADAKKDAASKAALAVLDAAKEQFESLKSLIAPAFKLYCMRASDPAAANSPASLLLSALAKEALAEDSTKTAAEVLELTAAAIAARKAADKAELELQTSLRAERAAAAASGAAAAEAEAKAAQKRAAAASLREKDESERRGAARSTAAVVRDVEDRRRHLYHETVSGRIGVMLEAALPPGRREKPLSPEEERLRRERRLAKGLPATKEEGRLLAECAKAAKHLRDATKAGGGGKAAIDARAKGLAELMEPKGETSGDKAARIAEIARRLAAEVSATSARKGKSAHGAKASGGAGGW